MKNILCYFSFFDYFYKPYCVRWLLLAVIANIDPIIATATNGIAITPFHKLQIADIYRKMGILLRRPYFYAYFKIVYNKTDTRFLHTTFIWMRAKYVLNVNILTYWQCKPTKLLSRKHIESIPTVKNFKSWTFNCI